MRTSERAIQIISRMATSAANTAGVAKTLGLERPHFRTSERSGTVYVRLAGMNDEWGVQHGGPIPSMEAAHVINDHSSFCSRGVAPQADLDIVADAPIPTSVVPLLSFRSVN